MNFFRNSSLLKAFAKRRWVVWLDADTLLLEFRRLEEFLDESYDLCLWLTWIQINLIQFDSFLTLLDLNCQRF